MGEDVTPPPRRKEPTSQEPDSVPPKGRALGDTALRFEPPPQDALEEEAAKAPPRPRTPAPITPFAPAQPTAAETPLPKATPPAQQQAAPPAQKKAAPPAQKTTAPPAQKAAAPPVQKKVAPPVQKAAPAAEPLQKAAPAKKLAKKAAPPPEPKPEPQPEPAPPAVAIEPPAPEPPAVIEPPTAPEPAPAAIEPQPAKKTAARKAPAQKAPAQKAPAKKAVASKTAAKKAEPASATPPEPVKKAAKAAKKAAPAKKTAVTKATPPAATTPEPEPIIEPPRPVIAAEPPVASPEPAASVSFAEQSDETNGINPAYLPETLAVAAVDHLSAAAKRRVGWYRLTYPDVDGEAISRAITREFVRRARRQGFAAGLAGPTGLVVEAAGVAWLQAKLVLHLAAAFGHDPGDRRRAAELLVLQRVHATVETAEAAVRAAERAGGRRADPRVGVERVTTPLARMVGAGLLRAAATRLARRVVPGAGLIVGSVTAARSTERLAARAVRYYRGMQS
ncbi:hypothetical protein ACFFTR_49775 [Dactylosporangium vinaceum]|uniref:Uncharacterized protein n=2 Tax=Dactylosporangium vinaceum TaxID=53362 RepID=A0ABV5MQQ8_9ACTN